MGGAVGVDGEPELVDGNVMMKPADGYKVVGMVVAAVASLSNVVGLEPVAAGAAFDRTLPLVPPQDEASHRRGDRLPQIRISQRVKTVRGYDPDPAGAEDLGEGVGSDPGSRGDGGSLLSERF